MAHFAELNENNIVQQVIVVHNNELLDENNQESEQKGIEFCKSLFGLETIWKQTSYNGNFRKHYAGFGFTYNEQLDAFVSPQPFPSWNLDEETCLWVPPIPSPNDGKFYNWNEETMSWEEVNFDINS